MLLLQLLVQVFWLLWLPYHTLRR